MDGFSGFEEAARFLIKRRKWVNEERGVRSKKINGTLEESARGAQLGLLVILATALLWAFAMWVGYRYL